MADKPPTLDSLYESAQDATEERLKEIIADRQTGTPKLMPNTLLTSSESWSLYPEINKEHEEVELQRRQAWMQHELQRLQQEAPFITDGLPASTYSNLRASSLSLNNFRVMEAELQRLEQEVQTRTAIPIHFLDAEHYLTLQNQVIDNAILSNGHKFLVAREKEVENAGGNSSTGSK